MIKLSDLVLANIAEERAARNKPVVRVYPSSIGKCTRSVVYKMLGYPVPLPEPIGLSRMENGDYFHSRMEERFAKMGILVAPELPILNEELNISGRTDAVIFNPNANESKYDDVLTLRDREGKEVWTGVNKEIALVELKSINSKGFSRVLSKGPENGHPEQLLLYMYLTGIKQGLLLYENKNDQSLHEIWIDYDEVKVQKIIDKINTINHCVKTEVLPDREGSRSSFVCGWCDFKDVCWCENVNIPSLDDII